VGAIIGIFLVVAEAIADFIYHYFWLFILLFGGLIGSLYVQKIPMADRLIILELVKRLAVTLLAFTFAHFMKTNTVLYILCGVIVAPAVVIYWFSLFDPSGAALENAADGFNAFMAEEMKKRGYANAGSHKAQEDDRASQQRAQEQQRRAEEERQREQQSRRNDQSEAGAGFGVTMTRKQALEVLELSDGATRDQIMAAYKRLMVKNHPDQGGSTFIAKMLNQAKDVLVA
jgi:hypothetical protein